LNLKMAAMRPTILDFKMAATVNAAIPHSPILCIKESYCHEILIFLLYLVICTILIHLT
jgi:hypothetical protein